MGIQITPETDIEQRLGVLSALTGRNAAEQAREAILRGLEDMEDIAAADAVMERSARRGKNLHTRGREARS